MAPALANARRAVTLAACAALCVDGRAGSGGSVAAPPSPGSTVVAVPCADTISLSDPVMLNATFHTTGFCNHNDAWTLRPSASRTLLRQWLADVLQ